MERKHNNHTDSTAHRNSKVPTAQPASRGVKLNVLVGEITVTSGGGTLHEDKIDQTF